MKKLLLILFLAISCFGENIIELKKVELNLLSESGNRFLSICAVIDLVNESRCTKDKEYIFIDSVITVGSSHTFEEISTTKGKAKLKNAIKEKINQNPTTKDCAANIYFSCFYVTSTLASQVFLVSQE